MRTINRYIMKEVLQTFVFAFLGMTALLIIVGLVREMMDNSVPLDRIMRLIPFVMLEMSRISIPVTFLLAVTTCFARMSGNNEIVALKSLGISPWKVLWPIMFLGVLVSMTTVWLSDMAITWGRNGITTAIYYAAEDIILNQLKEKHQFSPQGGDLTIMVKGVENRRLISPVISLKKRDTTIEAKDAQLKIDFATQKLTVILNQVCLSTKGGGNCYFDNRDFSVSLDQVIKRETGEKRPADMGLKEIPVAMEQYAEKLARSRRQIAATRAFDCAAMGNVEQWNNSSIQNQKNTHKRFNRAIARLSAEPPRRWATGFSCLFFIWLGAPLAIWMKKSDIFSSFFACFIPILIIYYPLLMFGMQGAKKGTIPPNSVWLANIVVGVVGFWFLKRIHRY